MDGNGLDSFCRPGQTGSTQSVQYGPAFNSLGAAWQVYSGDGANARADLVREPWIPAPPAGTVEPDHLPPGTLTDWELSPVLDAAALSPGTLPDLERVQWESVRAEPPGIVLISRYRTAAMASLPFDPTTRIIDADSVMGGRVAGSKVVLARTEIIADRAEMRRMHFGYSDGVIIYCNGRPLFFGMNAQFFRGDGIMSRIGDAVYLPLEAGRNEIVLAVTEFTGGWAFWARLDAT